MPLVKPEDIDDEPEPPEPSEPEADVGSLSERIDGVQDQLEGLSDAVASDSQYAQEEREDIHEAIEELAEVVEVLAIGFGRERLNELMQKHNDPAVGTKTFEWENSLLKGENNG